MKYGIPEHDWEKVVEAISRDPRVQRIILYGSRAKEAFQDGSDIGLCLQAPELDNSTLLKMENDLDDLLLPWKIDIAIRHRIDNPDLLAHIERVGKTLFLRTAVS